MHSISARLWIGLCIVVLAVPASLAAQGGAEGGVGTMGSPPSGFGANQANFCRGTYALCITAQCAAVATIDRLGNYSVDHALCECDVIEDSEQSPAWSMGPGSCGGRGPVEQGGREFLISTYSNLYNDTNREVRCGKKTLWAWCYGAPCVVDEEDPSKALCNCPLVESEATLLVDDCSGTDYCGQIWSATTPAGACFANCRYYGWMTEQGYSTHPPAKTCTDGEPLCQCPEGPITGD